MAHDPMPDYMSDNPGDRCVNSDDRDAPPSHDADETYYADEECDERARLTNELRYRPTEH